MRNWILTWLGVCLIGTHFFAYSVHVKVIEGYKSQACLDCVVQVKKYDGTFLFEKKVDENGELTLDDLKGKKYNLHVSSESTNYKTNIYNPSGKDGDFIKMIVYPTLEFEKIIREKEDKLYGEADMSVIQEEKLESVDEDPRFLDSTFKFQRFISKHVVYPRISIELGEQGTVVVSFIVETDGAVSHVSIKKSVSPELDEESIRLIRMLPALKPGVLNQEPSRVLCEQKIVFTLR
jgi:TonB family protein